MLTPQDVHSVQFDKTLRGYRTEDVDRFLDKVEEQLREDIDEADALCKRIAELTSENQRLNRELEGYHADGEMLKSALINAQRMGENVIREANQKSEEILHRANLRADDIIRDANELLQKAKERAEEIVNEGTEQRQAEEREYERVRLEVTRFKADVLNLYRNHVASLSRLPEYQKEAAEEDSAAEALSQEEQAELLAEQPQTPDAPGAEAADEEEAEEARNDQNEDFWDKDETQLKVELPAPAENKPADVDYSAFQGIKFSE